MARPGQCIISGFHSVIGKECLQIILYRIQPIIICPVRSVEGVRMEKSHRQKMTVNA
ncbi:MAG: hypothetical protein JRJ85_14600 [Deltaproteobacteria bacterium]|nr:hypothetical protein [Deltaproteobacteria bacterium]